MGNLVASDHGNVSPKDVTTSQGKCLAGIDPGTDQDEIEVARTLISMRRGTSGERERTVGEKRKRVQEDGEEG